MAAWRAASFVAALFAITLNFLQPLAHAALLRDGGPQAMASLWGALCLPSAGDDESRNSSAAVQVHDCCLGLAHAPVLVAPSGAFLAVDLVAVEIRFTVQTGALAAVSVRDGPCQPRGPPSLA